MKINLELEVGAETGVIIAALENLNDLFKDPLCDNPTTQMYVAVSARLREKVLQLAENKIID